MKHGELDLLEYLGEVEVYTEIVDYFVITGFYLIEYVGNILLIGCKLVALVEQICDLLVGAVSFSGSGRLAMALLFR